VTILRASLQRNVGSNPSSGKIFFLEKLSDRLLGPRRFPFDEYQRLFFGVKPPEREANYWLPSTAEVKDEWICISTSPFAF
jgi:hypothetical protein